MPGAPLRRTQKLSPRTRWLLALFLVALLGLSLHRLSQTPEPRAAAERLVIVWQGSTMGTRYSVKVVPGAARAQQDEPALRQTVERALEEVDASMSTYRRDSELSRWNDAKTTDPVAISEPLRRVMEVALEVGRASGGALDVTVGPLVDAWGFGPGDGGSVSAAELTQLRAHTGLAKLALTEAGLQKLDPALRVDLSAVAKGYAVDLIGERLAAYGVEHFFVEVGGEVLARGRRADGTPWRAGIEQPTAEGQGVLRVLSLRDQALATSGDYRNFYERDGVRFSHVIDPRTGRPVTHALASVSVVHERVAVADAWATALTVLGSEEGYAVAAREELAALFVARAPDGTLNTRATPRFTAAFEREDD
jgi:FAD:protein FMN transferase